MNKYVFLLVCGLVVSASSFAQKEKMTKEDKQEKNDARTSRVNAKNDYAVFRKQAMALKEFADEKKKIYKLQTESKMPVKVVITIDSLDEGDATTKALTGAIVQNVGDNATTMYDLSFDRKEKKIVSVKKTAEAIDAEKDAADEKAEKAEKKATTTKPTVHKKKGDDDDDDDEPAEKPSKKDKDDE